MLHWLFIVLQNELAEGNATAIVTALGRCLVAGVTVPAAAVAQISIRVCLTAADALIREYDRKITQVKRLKIELDRMDLDEWEETALSLAEFCLEAWAALEALESFSGKGAVLDGKLAVLRAKRQEFEAALRQEAELMSIACGTNLLDNWRKTVSPNFQQRMPWILSGELERTAVWLSRKVAAKLPPPNSPERFELLRQMIARRKV